jgi:hypothetical protein
MGVVVLCSFSESAELKNLNSFSGPLKVHPHNPRYFTDGTGKTIYLTGSHVWDSFQDWGGKTPKFDYTAYLNFLNKNNHNFIRLWKVGECTKKGPIPETLIAPMPWERNGSNLANDGQPKFDLTKFNEAYFKRLRSRVIEAGKRGIYVSVMLFDGIFDWTTHPFNPANNVNGIDGEGDVFFTLKNPKVIQKQKEYIRKVIDTLNNLDNVLYEIGNEIKGHSVAWQYHMINYIRDYEKTKSKRHPIGMTAGGRNLRNIDLFESPADWICPRKEPGGDYCFDPPEATGKKVIISDTDHLVDVLVKPTAEWVWKSFLRGINPILMDVLQNKAPGYEYKWNDPSRPGLVETRIAMGQTLEYARRMNLVKMVPQWELSYTRYCLANRGMEYLVYVPITTWGRRERILQLFGKKGDIWVDLSGPSNKFQVEWFNPKTGKTFKGEPITGGNRVSIKIPFAGEAVLYLKLRNGSQ